MQYATYAGAKTSQISFPLGGIGTGCIGLAGNGRLIDWEIFNRPNKGSVNGFSHFAVRAENEDGVVAARVCHGDLLPPYQGELHTPRWSTFGWGPRREYLAGLPHFREAVFRAAFPEAQIEFVPDAFPGQVTLCAFNPFIPLDDRNSGIPAAFFEFSISNPTERPLTYTLVGVLGNPLPAPNLHEVRAQAWGHSLQLRSASLSPQAVGYGDLTLATDAGREQDVQVSYQQYWFRGAWFDNLEVYWHDLLRPGPFANRSYPAEQAGQRNEGLLAVHLPIAPGQTRRVRFVISWSFPNCENYWKPAPAEETNQPRTWRNYYATVWPDSLASAEYALRQWGRLAAETKRFQEAILGSTLPPVALEAVTANLAVLKSPTVLRLEDGTFYGWEGCHPTAGCCEGSCTHVWNYAQALPFLFPQLERSMRTADYTYNLRPDGGMPFRLQLPLGSERWHFRPCADGQFGGVMKSYRDWKISGDTEWLRRLWPAIRASLEYAWSSENGDRWDPERTGVLWGRQHHTLDMELFGPNSWLTGMYLGALKAAAEMAAALGEPEAAAEYRALFEQGKTWVDAHLFNGEYYHQVIDLEDKSVIEPFAAGEAALSGATLAAYWNDEYGEIKYQIGEGCELDQVLAQWHANLYGLGEIFDPAQVKRALAAIYRYNFKTTMRDDYNPCRVYSLNGEAGLVIAAWPPHVRKPRIPLPYSQETQNGYEYAAAIQMIQSGLVDEGIAAVKAIRDRYDGEKRNPWNEFECGSNYARSMASYALLNAFAGFEFDMVRYRVGFNPLRPENGRFTCFWSLDGAWGTFAMAPECSSIQVLAGTLTLSEIHLPYLAGRRVSAVTLAGQPLAFAQKGGLIHLPDGAAIAADRALTVEVE